MKSENSIPKKKTCVEDNSNNLSDHQSSKKLVKRQFEPLRRKSDESKIKNFDLDSDHGESA